MTTIIDSGPNSYHANTMEDAGITFASDPLVEGGGFSMEFATTGYIDTGDKTRWNHIHQTADFAISFWFRDADPANATLKFLCGSATNGTEKGIAIYINDDTLTGSLYNGSTGVSVTASSSPITTDFRYHHLVFTGDGSNLYLYLDGVQEDSDTTITATGDATNKLRIGERPDGTDHFDGNIDEFTIFDRGLTEEEIKNIYYEGRAYKAIQDSSGQDYEAEILNVVNFDGTDVFDGKTVDITPPTKQSTLHPDSEVGSLDITGSYTDLDEGVDTPDGNEVAPDTTDAYIHMGFENPAGSLEGVQYFRIRGNGFLTAASGDLSVGLYENGSSVRSETIEVFQGDQVARWAWHADEVTNADDVEIYLDFGSAEDVTIDAVEWVARTENTDRKSVMRWPDFPATANNNSIVMEFEIHEYLSRETTRPRVLFESSNGGTTQFCLYIDEGNELTLDTSAPADSGGRTALTGLSTTPLLPCKYIMVLTNNGSGDVKIYLNGQPLKIETIGGSGITLANGDQFTIGSLWDGSFSTDMSLGSFGIINNRTLKNFEVYELWKEITGIGLTSAEVLLPNLSESSWTNGVNCLLDCDLSEEPTNGLIPGITTFEGTLGASIDTLYLQNTLDAEISSIYGAQLSSNSLPGSQGSVEVKSTGSAVRDIDVIGGGRWARCVWRAEGIDTASWTDITADETLDDHTTIAYTHEDVDEDNSYLESAIPGFGDLGLAFPMPPGVPESNNASQSSRSKITVECRLQSPGSTTIAAYQIQPDGTELYLGEETIDFTGGDIARFYPQGYNIEPLYIEGNKLQIRFEFNGNTEVNYIHWSQDSHTRIPVMGWEDDVNSGEAAVIGSGTDGWLMAYETDGFELSATDFDPLDGTVHAGVIYSDDSELSNYMRVWIDGTEVFNSNIGNSGEGNDRFIWGGVTSISSDNDFLLPAYRRGTMHVAGLMSGYTSNWTSYPSDSFFAELSKPRLPGDETASIYYKFSEAAGPFINSQQGLDATVTGAPTFQESPPNIHSIYEEVDHSITVDGDGFYVPFRRPETLINMKHTISVYFKFDSTGATNAALFGVNLDSGYMGLYRDSTNLKFRWNDGTTNFDVDSSGIDITDEQWHRVTVYTDWDNDQTSMWLDGIHQGDTDISTLSGPTQTEDNNLYFGTNSVSAIDNWKGGVAAVRIWLSYVNDLVEDRSTI